MCRNRGAELNQGWCRSAWRRRFAHAKIYLRSVQLLGEDPSLVDPAAAKEAVMRHAPAKQKDGDDERCQEQDLADRAPG